MASVRLNPPLVICAGAIFPIICSGLVALRFYGRFSQKLQCGIDDYLTLPALALLIGICAAILRGVALHAVAYPTPPASSPEAAFTTSSRQQVITRQVFFACEIMMTLTLGFIKLSCMFFYKRIFYRGSRKSARIVWATITTFIAIWAVTFFFVLIFTCGDHQWWVWTSLANEAKCMNTKKLQDTFAVTDVFTDFLVLSFPIPMVWRLQMSAKRKLGICGIFLLGTFALMASLTRMSIYIEALSVEFASHPPDEDLLTTAALYFVLLEAGIGLIAACLPTLYGTVFPRGVESWVHSFVARLSLGSGGSSDRKSRTTQDRRNSSPSAQGKPDFTGQNKSYEMRDMTPASKGKSSEMSASLSEAIEI